MHLPMVPAGHIRAICILFARLVKENESLIATAIIPPVYLEPAFQEIDAELGDASSNQSFRKRLR